MKKETKTIVDKIIDSLNDRGGFDGWWGNIDESIQEEIMDEIGEIIESK